MSTRLEQEKYNWKALVLVYFLFVALFVFLKLVISVFQPDRVINSVWFFEKIYWLIVYPMLMASILINNLRKASITISDFSAIPDVDSKLLKHVEKFSLKRVESTPAEVTYLPASRFRQLFKNWFDAERLTVSLSPEIIKVTGPIYRISQLDDTLKWNKDFKA